MSGEILKHSDGSFTMPRYSQELEAALSEAIKQRDSTLKHSMAYMQCSECGEFHGKDEKSCEANT